ncbi:MULTISPECIES: ester cyclase [unclassified Arthrobacter]|uniref:ester cyclase n=1 Tax=unclassified Arthrobacter TaxID=235627 RepID=UPI0009717822|nr:ester cyclase [Arthrobacter sp. QXT-31]APX02115.1 ester cyclase [Arthrobacter sp. QXT-31]
MSRRDTILKAWNGAWGNGDFTAFEQLLAPGYVRRSKSGSEDYAALRKTIEAMHTAFPDSRTEILEIIEDGPKVAVHWQTTGTHTGEFMDVPATGRSIAVTGASFLKFDGDKLAEEWVVWDPRELLSALGIWHLGAGNA